MADSFKPRPPPSSFVPRPAPIPGYQFDPAGHEVAEPSGPTTLQGVIDAIIGYTPTEKAVTGTVIGADIARAANLLPNPLARAAGVAAPIAVGALSDYLQGQSALGGAATGALQSVPANILAATSGALARQKIDVKELTNVVKEGIPTLAPHIDRKVETWDQLFRGGQAAKIVGDALSAVKQKIRGAIGIKGEVFPLLSAIQEKDLEKRFTKKNIPLYLFDETERDAARRLEAKANARPFHVWDEEITRLNQQADRFNQDKKPAAAAAARARAYKMTEELTERIRQVDPALADEYSTHRQQMYDTLSLKRVLRRQGVITTGHLGNRINMPELMKLLNVPGVREAFEASPTGKNFLKAAFRGAPPIGADVPPEMKQRFWTHLFGWPGLSGHPTFGQRIGRRVPVPATPFMEAQRYLTGGSGEQ